MRTGSRQSRRASATLARACTVAMLSLIAASPARAEGPAPTAAQRPVSPAAEQQARRDAAAQLKRLGYDVDWRLASAAELRDWSQRAAQARLLHDRFGVDADWRAYQLRELKDWEARIV